MDNLFVYVVQLPPDVPEMVAPCADGYTLYLNDNLGPAGRARAYRHALEKHIKGDDFQKGGDVELIEFRAHKEK